MAQDLGLSDSSLWLTLTRPQSGLRDPIIHPTLLLWIAPRSISKCSSDARLMAISHQASGANKVDPECKGHRRRIPQNIDSFDKNSAVYFPTVESYYFQHAVAPRVLPALRLVES